MPSSPSCSGGRSTSGVEHAGRHLRAVVQRAMSAPIAPAPASGRTAPRRRAAVPTMRPNEATSRGVARPAAAFPPSRSASRTPSSAERSASRALASRTSAATASRRDSIAFRSTSGARSHCRSSRAPIGVFVRSSTDSSVPSVLPRAATPPTRGCGASSRPAASCRRLVRPAAGRDVEPRRVGVPFR